MFYTNICCLAKLQNKNMTYSTTSRMLSLVCAIKCVDIPDSHTDSVDEENGIVYCRIVIVLTCPWVLSVPLKVPSPQSPSQPTKFYTDLTICLSYNHTHTHAHTRTHTHTHTHITAEHRMEVDHWYE